MKPKFEPKVLDARVLLIGLGTVGGTALIPLALGAVFSGSVSAIFQVVLLVLVVAGVTSLLMLVPSFLLWTIAVLALRRPGRSERTVATLASAIVALIGSWVYVWVFYGMGEAPSGIILYFSVVPLVIAVLLARSLYRHNDGGTA